ncbi:Crp/Fnr family transcriptional regulator [Sphingomonas sp. NIC1]|uniref:Crp/Fnr family transcriptional regulator n=1 Tax=Sphingomonas sp. NIC1 TaxID=1961362 RepID=UPI000B0666ED|nr:helix-turn-helix domain-containing protein [Sphingomonas sp. NIC1]
MAHLLCEMSARLGDLDDGESRFELPLTQEQIADVLGLTSVHVNRTVQQLRAESLIETKGRTVMIADMDALRQIAGFDPAYLQDGRASAHLAP